MPYTQDDIDALKKMRAKGIKRGKVNGEEVEFESDAVMLRRIREMEAELRGTPTPGLSIAYPKTLRGL